MRALLDLPAESTMHAGELSQDFTHALGEALSELQRFRSRPRTCTQHFSPEARR